MNYLLKISLLLSAVVAVPRGRSVVGPSASRRDFVVGDPQSSRGGRLRRRGGAGGIGPLFAVTQ